MLGVDTTEMGDAGVRGDARLVPDMSAATVDVEFSGVTGIASDRPYAGHRWTGVSLTGSSFDGHSGHGGTIDGQFHGEHLEDVMGGGDMSDNTWVHDPRHVLASDARHTTQGDGFRPPPCVSRGYSQRSEPAVSPMQWRAGP